MLERVGSSIRLSSELEKNRLAPRSLLDQYVVLTFQDESVALAAYERLKQSTRILSVEPNRIFRHSSTTPSDDFFSYKASLPYVGAYQWGMALLNLQSAWDIARGTAYVGVLDNGIYCDPQAPHPLPCQLHPDLRSNIRLQFSRNFGTGAVNDVSEYAVQARGHGTHVAGIIAATSNNNQGVSGVCWNCSLAVLKWNGTYDVAAAALTFAADHGLQTVNMSFGDHYEGGGRFQTCSTQIYSAMCVAIAYAKERDVVIVGASGNGFEQRIQFPARHPDVVAVGGVQHGGGFWNSGYGLTGCGALPAPECGSNFGVQWDGLTNQVVAPAMDVVSTFYPQFIWRAEIHCADTWGPNAGILPSGYGDCTGTSMATPHVTGIASLLRTVNPLLSAAQVKALILANTKPCSSGPDSPKCGAGIPDAAKAVAAAIGSANAKNRLTPLFSLYSSVANDHVYTVVPQMAIAALSNGKLLPQPPTPVGYAPLGQAVPGYPEYPPCFSPCAWSGTPTAIVSVFTTHVDPTNGNGDLVPLYRMSWTCTQACSKVSHFYTTDVSGVLAYEALGYKVDGIEGYVFPTTKSQPAGTVKLCRKYSPARDDYILFPGTGPSGLSCGNGDGFTPYSDYTQTAGGTDWIGWVLPVRRPTEVCPGGVACGVLKLLMSLESD